MFLTYILVILILTVTTFVFANSMFNPSIAYGKNKAISNTIAGNIEQPPSHHHLLFNNPLLTQIKPHSKI
jgi:hypothetical protein